MSKPISDQIYAFSIPGGAKPAYERCSAADVGMAESWLRDAIFAAPDLVVGACRAAGLCDDEDWLPWHKEYKVPVGFIDVLLLSSSGRVGIVETKLASNPEGRRQVLAQALDYLSSLPERLREAMPVLPKDAGDRPIVDREEILASVDQGDVLVIIAGDELDSRIAKLSQGLLGTHLAKRWDLALVDVAVFREPNGGPGRLLVPSVIGSVVSEARQVVRVIVEGDTPKSRISVEPVADDDTTTTAPSWNEERFFQRIEAQLGASAVADLALKLKALARSTPSLVLAWGRGQKDGSMTVKRQNGGLIEVYSSGWLGFRFKKFPRALGDQAARNYRRALESITPRAKESDYPMLPPEEAKELAPRILDAIQQAVAEADGLTTPAQRDLGR